MQKLQAFIAFDLETTGLSPENDSLLEIGAVRFENGQVQATFSALVKPRTPVSLLARHLTGISEAELEEAKTSKEAIQEFFAFAGDLPWVAHNADFDLQFLAAECKRAEIDWPQPICFDSLLVARMAWPLWPNHRLETVAKNLQLQEGKGHRAVPDAEWSGWAWLRAEDILAAPEESAVWNALWPQLPEPWNRLADARSAENGEGTESLEAANSALAEFPWSPLSVPSEAEKAQCPEEAFWHPGGALEVATASLIPSGLAWPGRWLADVRKSLSEGKCSALESSDKRAPVLALAVAAVHALKTGKPVLLAVADARQEDAVLKDGAERVVAALGGGISVVSLREPDGYLSTARLPVLLQRFSQVFSGSERLQMLPVLAWAKATGNGDLLSFPGIAADRNRTLGLKLASTAFAPTETFAFSARQAAENAQVIVVRHETFLRDLELDGALIPVCDGVLVLESQRLPEAMESAFGREFHFFKLRHTLQCIGTDATDPSGLAAWLLAAHAKLAFDATAAECMQGLAEKALATEKTTQKWLSKLGRQVEKRTKPGETRFRFRDKLAIELGCPETPVIEAIESLQADLVNLAAACEKRDVSTNALLAAETATLAEECRHCASRLGEVRTVLARVCDSGAEDIAWLEEFQNPHKIRIKSRSSEAGALFAERLQNLHRGGCFIGSALSLGDHTQRHFASRLGLVHLGKPPRYGVEGPVANEKLALLMPFAPAPQGSGSLPALAVLLGRLLESLPVPTTIFVPSQTVLKALREGLTAALPGRLVIAQGLDGHRDNLTFLFKQAANPILLGQDWPTDLMDAQGKTPCLTVITRLPFAPPSDPLIAARGEMAQQAGKHPLFEVLVPEAASRLKELVQKHRRMGEKHVLWVVDPRAARERYGSFMVRGLANDAWTCAAENEVLPKTLEWLQA